VVKFAWELREQGVPLRLETVSLADKDGLLEAFRRGIKTIPTVILLEGEREMERIVGAPKPGELKDRLDRLTSAGTAT
jgi:hypothetical protein